MKIKKILSNVMCASLVFSNLTVANASSNIIIDESPLDGDGIATFNADDSGTGTENEWATDESNLADVEVTYQQSSSYSVTIPKTIALDSNKRANYSVKVEGDIDTNQRVYVSPVDVISDTEEVDFYMKDQNSKKTDVIATITQNKTYWSSDEVASGYEEIDNSISAPDLTSGSWKGTFQVEIKLQSLGNNNTGNEDDKQQVAGLYDADGVLLASWEDSGIDETCSNAKDIIKDTYPNTSKVIIPDSVTSIYGETTATGYGSSSTGAFLGCKDVTEIVLPNTITSIGDAAFSGCGFTEIVIPDSVTEIGQRAFSGCRSLTSINIPNGVTRIEEGLFNYCTSLINVTIPDSVTSIGVCAFSYCTALTELEIPNSITSLDRQAIEYCDSLTSIYIPDSVSDIGYYNFQKCESLTNIEVSNSNANYYSEDGVLFNKDKTKLICYPCGKTNTNYTIPNSVSEIAYYAFKYSKLKNVTIPNSVVIIGSEAFEFSDLTSVDIPESVTRLDMWAFGYCKSLTSIKIPSSIGSSLGQNTFQGCTSLKTAIINSDNIAYMMFEGCTSLSNVTISNTVKRIGTKAFSGCTSLTNLSVPNSVTTIDSDAFKDVSHVTYSGTATGSPWGAKSIN